MDKNAIKKYAVWARRELIERVSQRALVYGITAKDAGDPNAESVNGHLLSQAEKRQRQALIRNIKEKGYEQVMEEVAYTWFNRFAALRFMEVNGYLPSHIRVFTNDAGEFKPQILAEAIHLELDGLDMNKVYELESANKSEELFKYLLIVQCNALNSILPGMFQRIEDYTELLLPDYLLREGSVIEQMVTTIPEADWTDQVQIIGWLYQYYNTEPKDQVFANLKKNIKISKHDIPAATQLFTPDWIVCYMVENSLGRLWLEYGPGGMSCGNANDALKELWMYYLDEAEQDDDVEEKLETFRLQNRINDPSEIKCIDPCMGSGHILCYLFDVLVQIYEACGYSSREAAQSIVENNLYGLDIDDRAAQLAYFAVMMKARQYDRRFFTRGIQPHVMAIQESNTLEAFDHLQRQLSLDTMCLETANQLIRTFQDAKEYGSILDVEIPGLDTADHLMEQIRAIDGDFELMAWISEAEELLPVLAKQAAIMQQKYDVVVTNPPYMGSGNMGARLSDYVKTAYPDSKSDLFAVFIERCGEMTRKNGYQAMITQHAWMFLSSFEKLRTKLLKVDTVNMAHLGARAFEEIGGEVVQTTSFVLENRHIDGYKGTYARLTEPTTQQGKEDMFLAGQNRFVAQQDNFSKIPSAPVAYWASNALLNVFCTDCIGKHFDVKAGMCTGKNEEFIMLWHELDFLKSSIMTSHYCYTPHNKGGEYRKWYGNRDSFLKYSKESLAKMENNAGFRHDGKEFYFKPHIGWSKITSSKSSFRYFEDGFTFDSAGLGLFSDEANQYSTLALLNSKITEHLIAILNPTLNVTPIIVKKLPYADIDVREMVEHCIGLSKSDWDSFETSWDFQRHPLVRLADPRPLDETVWGKVNRWIKQCYEHWAAECEERFAKLKANEEKLNRIFIDIYGLQDELTPEVEDKDVTVRKADLSRDIRSFISYAVGCMFGRYSLDVEGLVYAGGDFNTKYCRWIRQFGDRASEEIDENGQLVHGGWAGNTLWEYDGIRKDGRWVAASYPPDTDNIIPICDDEYFEDDIVSRFVKFVETVYGADTLDENLKFIADALGGKGQPKDVIRSYFLNDFFNDHCKIYQKRPIYWQFDSGKKNGFKCLIYIHRYQPDTIARIRTDYVHEQQSRYRTAIADLEQRINGASTSERVKLSKQLAKLQAQAEEIRIYEEKIHHLADQMIKIDLDDGVKHNYEIFKDVLAKIK